MVQLDNPTTPNKIKNFSNLVNILQRYVLFNSPKNGKTQMRTFFFTEKRKSYDRKKSGISVLAIAQKEEMMQWKIMTVYPMPIVSGAAVAAICASKEPVDHNLNYPDSALMSNPNYNIAYREQAHKMKTKKLVKYFTVTAITETVLTVVAIVVLIALWI
jgi:hypothetical protein